MKIAYTGRQVELAPAQLKKLEARFGKIGRFLDGRRECEAHVILSLERRMHRAEATVNYYGRQLVGVGSSADLFTAIHSAAEKLEKQALKARAKWRDSKRAPKQPVAEPEAPPLAAPPEMAPESGQRVYRLDHRQIRKPMTLEEALLEMGNDRDYLVYRDAETDRVCVLLRRRDGGLDLVEA
jgi:putative sigma-54 modulation protein